MKKILIIFIGLPLACLLFTAFLLNTEGFISINLGESRVAFSLIFILTMSHLTISSMSLSFHRFHTHGGMILNRYLDIAMQTLLWLVTSMSMADWVAIHKVHHRHSDTAKDPHGPTARGFWHSLLKGSVDYNRAKKNPEVLAVRSQLKLTALETFYMNNNLMGPFIGSSLMILLFGWQLGLIYSGLNMLISPAFGVGGVNTLAHWWGYKNHKSKDNSRNLGFLVPLNFLICGELDHNNHHGRQKSCSFRHKWYEFDIGYVYIKMLEKLKLARVEFAYTPSSMKEELSTKWRATIERNRVLKSRMIELAEEFKLSRDQLVEMMTNSFAGRKEKLERPFKEFKKEILRAMRQEYAYNPGN